MAQPKEKTPKLSDAVQAAVDAYGFLKLPLEMGLINYSALARKIRPSLEKQLKTSLTEEAIAMALHRHVGKDAKTPGIGQGALAIAAECKVHLLPDMVALHYPYNRKLQERVHDAKIQIEHQGGNLYTIERANEISLITQKQFKGQIEKIAEKIEPVDQSIDVALLTVQYPVKGMYQPGVLNYLVQSLTHAQINLLGVFSSYSKISFVISETNAPAAYERITRTIETAKAIK